MPQERPSGELLFAYDQLMDIVVLHRYCRTAKLHRKVRLINHKLAFTKFHSGKGEGLIDIVRTNDPKDEVWGISYELHADEIPKLDMHMRVPDRYHKKKVTLTDRGGWRHDGFTYEVTLRDQELSKPSKKTLDEIIALATEWKLPSDWIEHLRSFETLDEQEAGSVAPQTDASPPETAAQQPTPPEA
jgi:gamma-glutamylcyclotransferase (GGCT)/AIG2-like uncharacterized protein YtfP